MTREIEPSDIEHGEGGIVPGLRAEIATLRQQLASAGRERDEAKNQLALATETVRLCMENHEKSLAEGRDLNRKWCEATFERDEARAQAADLRRQRGSLQGQVATLYRRIAKARDAWSDYQKTKEACGEGCAEVYATRLDAALSPEQNGGGQ